MSSYDEHLISQAGGDGDELDQIQRRADAATPGPWRWRNTGDPMLLGGNSRVVMAFSRMGMASAQPEFRDGGGLLVKAGKENLRTFPDAEFIANASVDIHALLALVRDQRSKLDRIDDLSLALRMESRAESEAHPESAATKGDAALRIRAALESKP